MILPSLKRIVTADYTTEEQPMAEKLSNTLNIGLESLYEALNKKLTVRENIKGMVKDVVVKLPTGGNLSSKEAIRVDLNPIGQVDVVLIGRLMTDKDQPAIPLAAPWITWQQEQNTLVITDIKGLVPSTSYKIRLVVLYN